MPRLKVAIEIASLDRGGLEAVVASLARGLPREGVDVLVVCTERGGREADRLRREGCRVEVLSAGDREAELRALLLSQGIGLLSCHYSALGIPVAAALGIPVVVTLHNTYAWLGAGVLEPLRALDPQVDHYTAVSESVADFTSRRFAIVRERIAVIRNGVGPPAGLLSLEERAAARAGLGIAEQALMIVQVARIERTKCQLALVEAMAAIRSTQPDAIAWLVGGVSEEDYARRVEERIASEGLEGRVVLAGARDDTPRILAAADVFVQASVIEGLSLATLEALRGGLPSVLTRTGDAAYLLGEGGGVMPGLLVDLPEIDPASATGQSLRELAEAEHPAHSGGLARALSALLGDLPTYRERALHRARALGDELGVERMIRETASLFLQVASSVIPAKVRQLAVLEAELDLERTRAEAMAGALEHLRSTLEERLDALSAEARTSHRLTEQILPLAQRTLDKLRLTHRLRTFWSGILRRKSNPRVVSQVGLPANHDSTLAPGPRLDRWLVIGVVPLDDIGGGQRSAQLARALAREGYRVTYTARFPRQESVDLELGHAEPGIETLPWQTDALSAWLSSRDERVRILIEVPEEEVVDFALQARARGARVVYDKVDNWDACTWAPWFRIDVEQCLATQADDVVASARLLVDQLRRHGREPALLPNAVDRSLFDPAGPQVATPPPDLVRGAATLVYAGSLWGDWFDWGLVAALARLRPSWQVNLIGDRPASLPLELPLNVHLLGLKPQIDLPPYYAHATACLIPFAQSPVMDAVSPLKVFEYLAMHRPVVATPMPELEGLPFVFPARSAEEMVAAVERAAAAEPPVRELEAYLQSNTWEARVQALGTLTRRPTTTVIVLCYNNEDVIGDCIDSLDHARSPGEYEVLVVDNGSTDGSLRLLGERSAAGTIRLLRNPVNGCSSGRNLGTRESASEIVVFLDSDQTVLGPGWHESALRMLAEHREIGAVGWNAGWFRPGSGRGTIVDDLPARGMSGRYEGAGFRTDVAYLATSGLALPRSVLARTRGFDETFDPTGFEDTDLSFQIKDLGYAIAYCPGLHLHHRPHSTTGALEGYGEVFARNERRFLDKWRHRPEFFFDVPAGG